jgi:hypothetical protein
VSTPHVALGGLALALTAALVLGTAACSDDDEEATTAGSTATGPTTALPAPSATITPSVPAGPTTPAAPPGTAGPAPTDGTGGTTTTAPPAPPPEPSAPAEADVALYWTRPFADTRPVQLPFHTDPATGPLPYLLYGSMTNTGTSAISAPAVVVTWRDGGGGVVHEAAAAAIDPLGVPLASLAPGATADVLVVVADPTVGPSLAAATPELAPWSA